MKNNVLLAYKYNLSKKNIMKLAINAPQYKPKHLKQTLVLIPM
jgi:hypothetical protein